MRTITEQNVDRIVCLEKRLIKFYRETDTYDAFKKESSYPHLWSQVAQIATKFTEKGKCRILELGAGMSGLPEYLNRNTDLPRDKIHLTCQDITEINLEYLTDRADETIIKNIEKIEGSWDIITHAYVLEHLVRPKEFMAKIHNMLPYGGFHLFQCPRYDMPFYSPPSLDHCKKMESILFAIRHIFDSKDFRIIEDPAVFHMPFTHDRDAVHLVNKRSIKKLHAGYAEVYDFHIPFHGWKDYIVKNFLTIGLIIKKTTNKTMEVNELGCA